MESRYEGIFRLLDGVEAEEARRVHSSIVGNVEVNPSAIDRRLEAVRVVELDTGIDALWADHLRALTAASAGEDVYWMTADAFGGLEHDEATEAPIGIDLPRLTALVAELEEDEACLEIESFDGFESSALNSLFCIFSKESSMFPASGDWISTAWDGADNTAIAGSRSLIESYLGHCPDVVDDVLTWTSCPGYLLARDIRQPGLRRPRAPKWLSPILGREPSIIGHEYEDSLLETYLSRLYGSEVASEIWDLKLAMERYEPTPYFSEPAKELELLKADRPELNERLAEIWLSSGGDH